MPLKSNIDVDVFDDLVSHIYNAAIDIERWPVYMQHLVDTLNARTCLLRVQNLVSKEVGTWVSHGLDLDYQPKYREHYVHIDPLVPAISRIPVGTVIQTASLLSNSEYQRTEFFNDYARPQEKINMAGGFLANDNDQVAVLGLHRPDGAGTYTKNELKLLKMLTPHMQRAFRVNRHLTRLERKDSAIGEILDRLPTAFILVDANGEPVFVNRMAERLMADRNGLIIKAGCVTATTKPDTIALHRLIFEAAKSDSNQGGSIIIRRPGRAQDLSVVVIPIDNNNGFELGTDSNRMAAAIFIGNPDQQYAFPLEILEKLYGFTPAEAKLAAILANGHSLDSIAEKLQLSKNTVRNQLKSCFHKTGARRQAELVKLILSGVPALETDDHGNPHDHCYH